MQIKMHCAYTMYIIELFVKWLNKNKRGTEVNPNKLYQSGIMLNSEGELTTEQTDEALTCKHTFMPVDTTGKVLACTKCGYLINNNK